eukprot:1581006-Pleurochrysis_carterae.AAC.1
MCGSRVRRHLCVPVPTCAPARAVGARACVAHAFRRLERARTPGARARKVARAVCMRAPQARPCRWRPRVWPSAPCRPCVRDAGGSRQPS